MQPKKHLTRAGNYARLYRFDVAAVTSLSAFGGYLVSDASLTCKSVLIPLFISLVLYNFVYVLNALSDINEDRLNKPHRPLPSGVLSPARAGGYLLILTVIATGLNPVFFHGISLFFAYFVLLLGVLYSVPPFTLKQHPFVAVLITAWGMTNPFYITGGSAVFDLFLGITTLACAVVVFKDISDTAGDREAGRTVITDIVSIPALVICSGVLFLCSALIFGVSDYPVLTLLPVISGLTLFHTVRTRSFTQLTFILYKRLIFSIIAGAVATAGMVLFERSQETTGSADLAVFGHMKNRTVNSPTGKHYH